MRVIKVKKGRLISIDNNGDEIKVSRMPMRIDGEMEIPDGLDSDVITIKNNLIIENADLVTEKADRVAWEESKPARTNARQAVVNRIVPNFRYRSATLADLQELLMLLDWNQG